MTICLPVQVLPAHDAFAAQLLVSVTVAAVSTFAEQLFAQPLFSATLEAGVTTADSLAGQPWIMLHRVRPLDAEKPASPKAPSPAVQRTIASEVEPILRAIVTLLFGKSR